MIRVKRGVTKKAKHKKWLSFAKGYFGRSSTCYRIAHERVERGMQHAFRHRKEFKRDMRALWISRINAATRQHGLSYSQFIHGVNKIGLTWNRKMLSECAVYSPNEFGSIVTAVLNQ